jgi:hypothetical protein
VNRRKRKENRFVRGRRERVGEKRERERGT